MRRTFFLFLFLLPFLSFGKGIFKREKIELIHIVDSKHVTVVTNWFAYEMMTSDEFSRQFHTSLKRAVKKHKTIWSF